VERSAKLLASLGDYLENCGGTHAMIEGWYTKTEFRKEGATAGTYDSYFFNSQGKRFRSKAEIARYFSLEAAPAKRENKTAEAKAEAKTAAAEAKRTAKDEALSARTKEEQAAVIAAARYPVTDDRLAFEEPTVPPLPPRPEAEPFDATPLDGSVAGDLLGVTDFLRAVQQTTLNLPAFSAHELLHELSADPAQ